MPRCSDWRVSGGRRVGSVGPPLPPRPPTRLTAPPPPSASSWRVCCRAWLPAVSASTRSVFISPSRERRSWRSSWRWTCPLHMIGRIAEPADAMPGCRRMLAASSSFGWRGGAPRAWRSGSAGRPARSGRKRGNWACRSVSRKSLRVPAHPHARPDRGPTSSRRSGHFPLVARAFDLAAPPAPSADPAPRLKPVSDASRSPPSAGPCGAGRRGRDDACRAHSTGRRPRRSGSWPPLGVRGGDRGRGCPALCRHLRPGCGHGSGWSGQGKPLPVVLFGPRSRAPAFTDPARRPQRSAEPVATSRLPLAFDAAAQGGRWPRPLEPIVAPAVPAGQAELPVVLSGPESPAPAANGRHCGGLLIRVKPESIAPLPLRVAEIVAEHAAANPVASAAVNAIRKHLVRAASDPSL